MQYRQVPQIAIDIGGADWVLQLLCQQARIDLRLAREVLLRMKVLRLGTSERLLICCLLFVVVVVGTNDVYSGNDMQCNKVRTIIGLRVGRIASVVQQAVEDGDVFFAVLVVQRTQVLGYALSCGEDVSIDINTMVTYYTYT